MFTSGADLTRGFCAGTHLTTKAGKLFNQHKTSLGYDLNSIILSSPESDRFSEFGFQVLIPCSNTTRDAEVRAAARTLRK